MLLKDLPADARPREKLLARGAGSLSDSELLALLLRTGIVGKSVLHLADELLATGIEVDALNALEGSPPGHRAAETIEERTRRAPHRISTRRGRHLPGDCPDEPRELAPQR